MNDSNQKVWLITGCSTGLGRALAENVLKTGATVAATARSLAALDDLKEKYPDTCLPLSLEVTDRKQCEEVVKTVLAQTQRLDVLVNNAGYGLIGSLEESTDEQIQRNFATIVFGAIHLLRAALPRATRNIHGNGWRRSAPDGRLCPTRRSGNTIWTACTMSVRHWNGVSVTTETHE